jgi:NADH-quinone oxidoreductase subunit G
MPKIIINGREIECRSGIRVLQAAIDAGIEVPHYCYHPGLSVVASCRLCLMEQKLPDPKTKEMVWSPKLVPSCQTPVKDGMEVCFNTERVRANQRRVMEHYLLNHPLDCPICDQAGECWLQDYSRRFGTPDSRMVDEKIKNPKKDVGPRTLLYQDRCVLCTRCVRFCQEIAGTNELCVVDRGNHCEIDAFPGAPLTNKLQGNVVDICPVGALLDKDFLFKQRVWLLRGIPSICAACSTGCAIHVDQNENRVYRLRPRYNPGVNDWWMCDEGRFGWKYIYDEGRITSPAVRRGSTDEPIEWDALPELIRFRLGEVVRERGGHSIGAQLSPVMACEEAWLLASFIREIAPEAALALGPVPAEGTDEHFPVGAAPEKAKFVIRAEKAPNRRGVEMVLQAVGGEIIEHDALWERVKKGELSGLWVVGGYPRPDWPGKDLGALLRKTAFSVVQDMFPNELTAAASVVLPACAWAEREGTFVNAGGLIQPFQRAINPPEGARSDGQFLFQIAGHTGLYTGPRVREMMARRIPAFARIHVPPPVSEYAH